MLGFLNTTELLTAPFLHHSFVEPTHFLSCIPSSRSLTSPSRKLLLSGHFCNARVGLQRPVILIVCLTNAFVLWG